MYEELYIIDEGKKLRVDLMTPSGIALTFKSNIFGDLSKITCSHSYTFKLPLTLNNRRVFDNVDDIRSTSNKIRRRLKAEYIQNGIPLFNNANLYVESVDAAYNAILTWGVIEGLQRLKENDVSIRKLVQKAYPLFGPCNALINEYSNYRPYVRPLYNAGVTYLTKDGYKGFEERDLKNQGVLRKEFPERGYSAYPLPVVPIYKLIKLINSQFGVDFNFGTSYNYGDTNENHELINLGVIPCVGIDDTAEFDREHWDIGFGHSMITEPGYVYRLTFLAYDVSDKNYAVKRYEGSELCVAFVTTGNRKIEFEMEGCLIAKFSDAVRSSLPDENSDWSEIPIDSTIELVFIGTNMSDYTDMEEFARIKGELINDPNYGNCWRFNFSKQSGGVPFFFSVGSNWEVTTLIEYNRPGKKLKMTWSNQVIPIVFYPSYSGNPLNPMEEENNAKSFPISLMGNMPDISCFTLVKTLYFMMGAFPQNSPTGDIVPVYYSDIREHIIKGESLDWSDKIRSDYSSNSVAISYAVKGIAQNNFYMMKNDNIDEDDNKIEDTDVYEGGIGVIHCEDSTIDQSKTIVQTPFYSPYLLNRKFPSYPTGKTIKFWYFDDWNTIKSAQAYPCVGIITPHEQLLNGTPTGKVWMSMKVWNGFSSISTDTSYAYLSRIMENPIIITENFALNELDLRDIDYSIPVYLSKYGAYFAIVSITRDSKGISKCELMKLPEEE